MKKNKFIKNTIINKNIFNFYIDIHITIISLYFIKMK